MKITLTYDSAAYLVDLSKPIDLSIPLGEVKCFYATDYKQSPLVAGDFVGSVAAGAPVNFFDVLMNPHGNGTHTECLGHITREQHSINEQLKTFHFVANLITVELVTNEIGDHVITKNSLKHLLKDNITESLIIRTLPNDNSKLTKDYSGTNPPYLTREAMKYLLHCGVRHLLLDLPSVDKEIDDGILAAHHIFWNVEGHYPIDMSRSDCTITELIFIPDNIEDGLYFLNIQIPSMNLDAAPSKPVIYKMEKEE